MTNCLIKINSIYPSFHKVEKRIADYILNNPEKVIHMTVDQIAREIGVAVSSITRFCKIIEVGGFAGLKISVAQSIVTKETFVFRNIKKEDDIEAITEKVFAHRIKALQDTLRLIDMNEFTKAIDVLLHAKKIEIYGVGASANLAQETYYRLLKIGLPVSAVTDPHIGIVSASMLNSDSAALFFSHTGRTKDVVKLLEIVKSRGVKTVCITNYANTPLANLSDVKLIIPPCDDPFVVKVVSTRFIIDAVLDSLFICITIKDYDSVYARILSSNKLLNQFRY